MKQMPRIQQYLSENNVTLNNLKAFKAFLNNIDCYLLIEQDYCPSKSFEVFSRISIKNIDGDKIESHARCEFGGSSNICNADDAFRDSLKRAWNQIVCRF